MPRRVTFRAPTRIDFGGGWTDVPPYNDREGGFVCNLAISRCATASVTGTPHPDSDPEVITDRASDRSLVPAALRRMGTRGVEVALRNDFPVGAGLGGSSAAAVATLAALAEWSGEALAGGALAERSRELEIADLGIAGGRQDHYAAVFGGALALGFGAGSAVDVQRIALTPATREALERRCVLVYTGQSRISGDTITAVLDGYRDGVPRVLDALARMKTLGEQMASAITNGDIDVLGRLVGEHWVHQRSLHPAITTDRIDAIIEAARDAGAQGAKALGASGGGCVLVIAGDDVERVRAAVEPFGTLVPFTIDEQGVTACR